jgi:hypothetical protein
VVRTDAAHPDPFGMTVVESSLEPLKQPILKQRRHLQVRMSDGKCDNREINIALGANGSRVRLFRDVAGITMDLNDIESTNIRALGSAAEPPRGSVQLCRCLPYASE